MLNSTSAQRFSEDYESESFGRLTKEHGASPYLRAAENIAIPVKPL
jgi:hypothetical protein